MECLVAEPEQHKIEADPADPCTVVVFGATGDLAKRKLYPALLNLSGDSLLNSSFAVLGVATRQWDDAALQAHVSKSLDEFGLPSAEQELKDDLASKVHYVSGDFVKEQTYQEIARRLDEIDEEHGTQANRIYYLAVSPNFFPIITEHLAKAGLVDESNGFRRIVIEKPFGTNLESAEQLNKTLTKFVDENQLYRIDHYLGKETVQNIMAFRFANGIFEPIWNRQYIDHVQITAAESVGVGDRGRYYDQAGALRDMVPNHLFQLLTLTAMEPPISFSAHAVRNEQVKVLRALDPLGNGSPDETSVRGQYGASDEGEGYREAEHVDPNSATPSFVALALEVDNWRWSGVPFYLRTGKCMKRRSTEIAIRFKKPPFKMFQDTVIEKVHSNWLVMRIQPDEGISLSFGAKVPGAVMSMADVEMNFRYQDHFGAKPQTGYERLLFDSMLGDATLFQRADMVENGWRAVEPYLQHWEKTKPDFPNYSAGTWGPESSDELLAKNGHGWRNCL